MRSRPPGQHHEGDAPPDGRQINSKDTQTSRSVVSKSQAARRHSTLSQSPHAPTRPIDPISLWRRSALTNFRDRNWADSTGRRNTGLLDRL